MLDGYTFLGRPIDVVETSRGCTYDCSFCSIIEMRGRNFHTFDFDRVLADIADARARGARAIFIVDDNITLNVARFEALCRAIIDAGLNDIHYIVQAMTSSIANHGETLAPLMRAAGFRYVFLGIENVLDEDLAFLQAAAKNAQREGGRRVGNATLRAIELLHRAGIYVVGGIIVGNPDDTRDVDRDQPAFARQYVDWPYIQHPTPYPGTPMTKDFRARGLIVNDRVGGIRRDDRRRADRTPRGRRDRVHALAGRALDEAAPHARRCCGTIPGSSCATGRACSRTRSAGAPGGRRSGSRTRARCSRATRRSGARERDGFLRSAAGDQPPVTPSWRPNLLLTRGS